MKKKLIPILAALLLIVIVVAITLASGLIKKYSFTDERADLNAYFNLQGEDQVGLVLQDEVVEDKGKLIDGEVYLNYNTVKNYFNSRFYWDANENVLLYTTPTDIIKAEVGSKDYYISKNKNTESYAVVKVDGDQAYIALDYVQKFTNIEYETFQEPNRVHITYQWGEVQMADVKGDTQVRVKAGNKSPILTDVLKGDQLYVLPEEAQIEEWTKVRTGDGYIGYILNKKIGETRTEATSREFEEPVYTNISKDYPINLVWHQVTNAQANGKLLELITNTKGVNTISPTWFSLSDNEGNIASLADKSYVTQCHQIGVEVWGLVDNFNKEVSTFDVLSHTSRRETLINQLIATAIEYQLDGLNIDFEELSGETGEHFIEFIRELSIKCRANGIVLSIDNYVPKAHTAHYDRREQGIVADYVIIMGYDEHYSGSKESGSVASMGFVREGIEKTLEEVPADKVINAVPFFSRLWKETPKTEEEIAAEDLTEEYVPYHLSSEALGMQAQQDIVSVNGLEPVWQEDIGQNYVEYEKDGSTYKMWIEDDQSIDLKAGLVKEYNLAGIAAWRLGLEQPSTWDVILKYVN
ncbi:glycosyl hydrolase family 18 protein [Diplocloster modestus]|uniref:SH3 domain-containing protein n=1 Tax=Diplocloster modestus TaxID=2850322 RepID=A0ABS6K4M4_9FIRM|nr:glycosyl hydrolase family 18 protein [Diplocloster modestus]MBU9725467.1 SH3 domain-containing protein [Diplocloster modestus]